MRVTPVVAVCLASALAAVAAPPAVAADPTVEQVMRGPAFQTAAAHLDADRERIVDEAIALQQIPAPTGQEARKAQAFADRLRAQGLRDVAIDAEGNVTAVRPGAGRGMVAVVAHLDTVFAADADLTVRREGDRIYAPGLADDSHGLAVLLGLARALDAAGATHEADILFVGSVGEEGLGDLRGVKHLLGAGPYRDRITRFIALDGTDPAEIVNRGLGSKRYRVTFTGPGGHSYLAFGTVNPVYALADATTRLARLRVPAGSTLSVGVVQGGTVVNAIPTRAEMQVDMRSLKRAHLDALERRLLRVVRRAARDENRARETKTGRIEVSPVKVGDRPSGVTRAGDPLVRIARDAVAAHGWTPRLSTQSTDANVPMSRGIPAVTLASGLGGGEHSAEEHLDVEPGAHARQLRMNLAAVMAAAGAA
ncbi:MAG TPA: M20/M25/M40 family metallo-hydrolase [Capillimicrobium sp.]|nr:M20/M25/M40 family metallo-hydrolase [Capillimicrobium sp.]